MNLLNRNSISAVLLIACLMTMSGCSEDVSGFDSEVTDAGAINIAGSYGGASRVSDTGFTDNDMMGVFIADYEGDIPGSLSDGNLHASNVKFTYTEASASWTGATTLYWKDAVTPIDVYGYYPFDASMSSPVNHVFRVASRQDAAAYTTSDFLWAKAAKVRPTGETIDLSYTHAMAGVTVRLVAGDGFDASEFAAVAKNVWIDNTVTTAVVNLEEMTAGKGSGEVEKVYPLSYNGEYRAVVVPQTVESGKCVVGLTIDGRNYELTKDATLTYLSGKMHTFTITVDKKAGTGDYEVTLESEAITAWVDDPGFHDGLMYQYIVVEVSEAGTLKTTMIDAGLNYKDITALKVVGPLNADDRGFIGSEMLNCSALNAADAIMTDSEFSIPFAPSGEWTDDYFWGAHGNERISHVVFPVTPFKKLGWLCGYAKGNQIIPEGVEEVDKWSPAKGATVSFPSTLRRIGVIGAINDNLLGGGEGAIRGELRLPEGLESYEAIYGFFTGSLHLPESLKSIGRIYDGNISGGLVIPQGIKEIPNMAFVDIEFSGTLELPDGIETIGDQAFGNEFMGCGFIGELVLPASLKEIGKYSFGYNKFTKIIWPKNLTVIGEGAFLNNNRLEGTVTIPEKISAVPQHTFSGCSMLTGLELHEDITYLGEQAFAGCERLVSIVCRAETPPLIGASTFNGVGLDHVTLEVPANAVQAYKSAPGWKEFKRITAYGNFVCRPSQMQALNKAKTQTVTINADGSWKVKSKPDWCTVTPASGNGKAQVILSVDNLVAGSGERTGAVEFMLDGKDAVAKIDVTQYDYQYGEDAAVALQSHSRGNGIPLYFIGDGWTGTDIASGSYLDLCREDMEHFFGIAPYNRLRDYFDVYSIVALSQESGVNTVYTYRDTRFGTIYTAGTQSASCSGYASQLLPDETLIMEYLKREVEGVSISDNDLRKGLVILVPNVTDYTGATYYVGDYTISICPPTTNPYPLDNRGVVQHEACGHGFGRLGDELISKNAFATDGVKGEVEAMHSREWFMNIATTSNMNTVPWAHMIFDPRYSDRVDVYEGGYGYTRGIFRPEANSCMNLGVPYFNSISRQYITKRILETAGVGFDIDEFYANDTFDWGAGARSRSGATGSITEIPGHKAPAFMSQAENRRLLKELRSKQSK